MTGRINDALFARVVQRIDPQCKLLDYGPLAGGVSAQVTALVVERPGGECQTLVLRRHGEVDLSGNPNIAADEFRLLHLLQSGGAAVPAPIFLDQTCEILSTPYLVIGFVDGEIGMSVNDRFALAEEMAMQLAVIHRLDGESAELAFLPRRTTGFSERPAVQDDSLSEGGIRDALEAYGQPRHCNAPVLLHGDYWPGNVLWCNGRISAIVDWEDAQVGDPLADVADARMELHWLVGADAAERFTQCYRYFANVDFTELAYWDLRAALRPASKLDTWGLTEQQVKAMRRAHGLFVEQAMLELS